MDEAFNTLFTNRDHLRDRTRKLYRHNVERLMSAKFEPTDDLNMLSTHPESSEHAKHLSTSRPLDLPIP